MIENDMIETNNYNYIIYKNYNIILYYVFISYMYKNNFK